MELDEMSGSSLHSKVASSNVNGANGKTNIQNEHPHETMYGVPGPSGANRNKLPAPLPELAPPASDVIDLSWMDPAPIFRRLHNGDKALDILEEAGPSGANGNKLPAPLPELAPPASDVIDLTWMDPAPICLRLRNGEQFVDILGEAGPSGTKRALAFHNAGIIDLTGLSDQSDDEVVPKKRQHFNNEMALRSTALDKPSAARHHAELPLIEEPRVGALPVLPPTAPTLVPQPNPEHNGEPLPFRPPQFNESQNALTMGTHQANGPNPPGQDIRYLVKLQKHAKHLEEQLKQMLKKPPSKELELHIERQTKLFKEAVALLVEETIKNKINENQHTIADLVTQFLPLPLGTLVAPLNLAVVPRPRRPKVPAAHRKRPAQSATNEVPVQDNPLHLAINGDEPMAQLPSPFKRVPNESVESVLEVSPLRNQNLAAGDEEPLTDHQRMLQLEGQALVPNTETFGCAICLCECAPGEGVVLRECVHAFCRDCLGEHVRRCDDERVVCPYAEDAYACDAVIQERELRALVSAADFDKRLAKTVRLAESRMTDSFHCRTPNCSGWCVHDEQAPTFYCPLCNQPNCLKCEAIHPGKTCEEYKAQATLQAELSGAGQKTRKAIEKMLKQGSAMHCPRCKVLVMKVAGCDWLTCGLCKLEICWARRMARWGPRGSGDNSGGCQCGVGGKRCHPKCHNCH